MKTALPLTYLLLCVRKVLFVYHRRLVFTHSIQEISSFYLWLAIFWLRHQVGWATVCPFVCSFPCIMVHYAQNRKRTPDRTHSHLPSVLATLALTSSHLRGSFEKCFPFGLLWELWRFDCGICTQLLRVRGFGLWNLLWALKAYEGF